MVARIKPINKPGMTILDLQNPPQKTTQITSDTGITRELHPLPPVHITEDDVRDPVSLARVLNDIHENVRRATLSQRQDPKSAPSYVRGVVFTNTSNVSANVTQTIPHTLNRPPTGCHPTLSQGSPTSIPVVISSTNTHATIMCQMPAGTQTSNTSPVKPVVATHDFQLFGD